ncbi:aromatic amino acid ammonia-lyase [Aeromicrobium ginsengisoli]|uniref:Aromatic amino acid lyase n=1 Tax=Aeromicrobium ginsengisoli TaxID=363867 RepID=A0A5M4FJK9_9ACTN|nr:aromatic amino acid ammonia-lyase [Aeromicrobium ginsengisoli]KAA1400162.1 aromatic amino acid lyase [Aeromicrobium ginsengisoli]
MIDIDGTRLTVADIVAASSRTARVEVTDSALAKVAASHAYAQEAAAERPIYGWSTGVGANRTVALTDPDAQALDLLRSHATSAAALRDAARVRAMLVVRLNQLAVGTSGIDPAIVTGLAGMIDRDDLPAVRELGSIGTGDLSALAATALALHESVPFGRGSALPFLSSNAATIADAALAVSRLQSLARSTIAVAALVLEAVDGNLEAFSPAAEQASPLAGTSDVCRTMRRLVPTPGEPARIQDPFGLRVLPQVHGALLDALDRLETVVLAMANSGSENPTFSPDLGVAHHGGFYAAHLAQALDSVTLATAQTAQLSLARLGMLQEPSLTGLDAFLGDGTPGASGTMIVEYVAASALSELRALATPASLQTATLSRGVEEEASFASLAARQALDSVAHFRTILAGELVAAVRCARQKDPRHGRSRALDMCGSLPDETGDRDLTSDLQIGESLVDELSALVTF